MRLYTGARTIRLPVIVVAAALLTQAALAQAPRPAPRQAPTTAPVPPVGGTPSVATLPPRDGAQAPTGTAILRGRVVGADGGAAVRKVRIAVSAPDIRVSRTAMTDDAGRYEVRDLPAGRYTLSASKAGFITLSYGQRRAREPGRPLDVGQGATIQDVDFTLPRGGAIEGQVFDDVGDPVSGVSVQAQRQRYVDGERQIVSGGGTGSLTDDLGRFRVYSLAPGDYYLSATLSLAGRPEGAPVVLGGIGATATYYPGTAFLSEALRLTVGLGTTVSGVTFQLVPARTASISGVVRSVNGPPALAGSVNGPPALTIVSLRHGGFSTTARVRPDGSFSFANLGPGEYEVTARSPDPAAGPTGVELGSARVPLDGSDVSIVLLTTRGATARGRIMFDGGDPPPTLLPANVRIRLTADEPGPPGVGDGAPVVGADWTFEATNQFGRRTFRATLPAGWYLKAVRRNGTDITDRPVEFQTGDVEGIEIVLTQTASEVSGTVTTGPGAPAVDGTVVIFADDRERWGFRTRYVRTARPDQNGRYTFLGLPPARYLAVAVDYLEPGEETNPDYLEALRRLSTPLTLGEGESKTADLRIAESP